jgi:OmpR-family two-component system manganese-sensing sensor histidine kinase
MFQTTRRRLALWYTTVTAVLLLLFASGFYLYVRTTLIERIDDTLNHVVEVVVRSLVIESPPGAPQRVNVEASFRDNADSVEDDHIDLEWFSPTGDLLWSTFSAPLVIPLHVNSKGETVEVEIREAEENAPFALYPVPFVLRQVTQRVAVGRQVVGYLRVSHPWFEVTKPTRQLVRDLSLGTTLVVALVAAIGWLLSGLAIAPVRDSYQRLKQFTADASHELRNPIAVIQTNVQVALSDPDPDPVEQQEQLKVVERLTRRLGRLVDDLLFLARQDSGMIQMKSDRLPLDNLLEEVVEEQMAIATEKKVTLTLTFDPPSEGWIIQGDHDQLIRLFTNLISNAVQYTPADGSVDVLVQRAKPTGSSIQVQIKDTGYGIPEAALPYLFDRFYRVDPARSHGKTGTGSGLGLAIAKVITENHQGHIHVDSTPGKGTVFTVVLPAVGTGLSRVEV